MMWIGRVARATKSKMINRLFSDWTRLSDSGIYAVQISTRVCWGSDLVGLKGHHKDSIVVDDHWCTITVMVTSYRRQRIPST